MGPLWMPSTDSISKTRTHALRKKINAKFLSSNGQHPPLESYEDLYQWSIGKRKGAGYPAQGNAPEYENTMPLFWNEVWDEIGVIGKKGWSPSEPLNDIIDVSKPMASTPEWFPKATLNWAENMLKCRSPTKIALVQAIEPTPDDPSPALRKITYAELFDMVCLAVRGLQLLNVAPYDVVASYSSNCIENAVAMLASTALGAIWVSAAADFGPDGVVERLEQVKPRVIFSIDSMVYNGKVHDHLPKLEAVLAGLEKSLLSPQSVVIIPMGNQSSIPAPNSWSGNWKSWNEFLPKHEDHASLHDIPFWRGSFNHPLWVLFSSGTTGKPKPIIHRSGGMLLQLGKELIICGDFTSDDVFFYYTTTGWMMYNWLISGLTVGCTLVLYDGSPLKDPSYLWRLTQELRITVFGTSAKYLEQLAKGYAPKDLHDLSSLRMVLSTGSPLAPAQFDYVYEKISSNVVLGSITGGTDICSLFAGMNTSLPVYRGEIQCRMLGMGIRAYSEEGIPLPEGVSGDLVCDQHFPCQPLGFWPLEGHGEQPEAAMKAQARYLESYYEKIPGVWYHGDHVLITESKNGNGGGVVMLGRSDGVLNPGGIRFGSAEIYEVLDLCFSKSTAASSEEVVVDSLVVGQMIQEGTDERVILFLQLEEGTNLQEALIKRIKDEIRKRRSPRHVPARILQVKDVPHTLNGKKVEVPVKKLIGGSKKESLNASTLRNPECLDEYVTLGVTLRDELLQR